MLKLNHDYWDCHCRLFLRKLKDTLKIPVLALVDSDPYGLKILSVFMKGRQKGKNPLQAMITAIIRCLNQLTSH